MRIGVIGVGARLRGDDAAGLTAVEAWRSDYPDTAGRADISVQTIENPGLALLDALEDLDRALIVDALNAGLPPGKILRIGIDALESFGAGSGSAHGWGVAETLQLGMKLHPDALPQEIAILALQGANFETGSGLSPVVAAQIPTLGASIEAIVRVWLAAR